MSRWIRSLIVLFAVAGLGASTIAPCVEGATNSAMEQMACCRHGHHTCGPHGTPADCCRVGSDGQQVSIVKAVPDGRTTTRAVIAAGPVAVVVIAPQASRILTLQSEPLVRSAGPPPYIAFSSLLI